MTYFLGVDVGTSSVRVGLFASDGKLVGVKLYPISVINYKHEYYEQSTQEIWSAVITCIKNLIKENCHEKNLLKPDEIVSIGFDATCSLVVLDENYESLPVSTSDNFNTNQITDIIMWMDHRAIKQAAHITSLKHVCLKTVGGVMSPEMDPAKILWLKENLFDTVYSKVGNLFSLPDYLVWKSTGKAVRSVCTTTCKWLYDSVSCKWDDSFWCEIGLGELASDQYKKIGSNVRKPLEGVDALNISEEMVRQTGLSPDVKIGISMIDAHAGGIGGIAMTLNYIEKNLGKESSLNYEDILVIVSGTSSCFMASSKKANFISGIWGPYYSAMVPDLFLNEAGQSSCGKLIEHVITTHPAYSKIKKTECDVYETLYQILIKLAKSEGLDEDNLAKLTKNIHIYPDFHGNRSPLADPNMKGSICGLNLDIDKNNLAVLYLACVQALVYQTRFTISIMQKHSMEFKILTVIGGLSNNKLYCQLLADICNLPVLVTRNGESVVLLGSGILGASYYDQFKHLNFSDLVKMMKGFDESNTVVVSPNFGDIQNYHQKKYKVFLKMLEDQKEYTRLMS